jgi:hypothetical protein
LSVLLGCGTLIANDGAGKDVQKKVVSCLVLKDEVEQDKLHTVGLLTDIHTGSFRN